jgi:B12 binding domain
VLLKPSSEQSRRDADRVAEGTSRSYGDALRAAEGLYERIIAPAMWRIGCLWEEERSPVADEHLATAPTG